MPVSTVFDLRFSATREVSFAQVTRNRMHRHSFYEPCIVIAGSGEFEHAGRIHALSPGDLFMADREIEHEIRSLRSRDLRLYFLAFTLAPAAARRVTKVAPPGTGDEPLTHFLDSHRVHVPGQWQLLPLFEHVMHLSRSGQQDLPARFSHDASLLLLQQIMAALTSDVDRTRPGRRDHRLRIRVVDTIERRLHEPLRIAAIARECGMSERTLRRRWGGWSSRTLNEEVTLRRIERATHLLLLPDVPIGDVGQQVGIADPAQFSRTFRRIRGLSPRDYRHRHLRTGSEGRVGGATFRTDFSDGERREYLV